MRSLVVASLVTSSLATVSSSVAAEPATPRVAIVVEVAVGVPPERADALAGELAAALESQLEVEARGGAEVVSRLPPGGLPDGCLAQPACVTEVARRLEVDGVLFIALVQLGEQLQVDASWLDAGGTTVAPRPRFELGPDDDVAVAFRGRAVTLLPEARLRRTIDVPVVPTPPRGRRMTSAAWALTAVGGVALGAGVGLGLATRSAYLACERDGCDADGRSAVRTRGLLADASFTVAALAALAGTVVYLRSAPRQPRVVVEVDGDGRAGVVVVGAF